MTPQTKQKAISSTIKILIAGIVIGAGFMYFLLPIISPPAEVTPAADRGYFRTLHPLLTNAKDSIHIVMFELRYYPGYPDSKTNQLLSELISAKERGVDVRVIIEGGEDFLGEDFIIEQKQACKYLKDSGIDVRFDEWDVTTHAKLVIVDDTVVISSTNWNYYAIEKNNEAAILVTSEDAVRYYERYFYDLWDSSEDSYCEVESYSGLGESGSDESGSGESGLNSYPGNYSGNPGNYSGNYSDKSGNYSLNYSGIPPGNPGNCSSIHEILQNRGYCDRKTVTVSGTVSGIKKKVSQAGNAYTTFQINDNTGNTDWNLRVFIFGNLSIHNGNEVTVEGKFYREKQVGNYKYQNEIDANRVYNSTRVLR